MYTGLTHFHSYWAYLAFLLLLVAIINSLLGLTGRKEFKPKDRKIAVFALAAVHIQALIGLVLYVLSPYLRLMAGDPSAAMGVASTRLLALEHPLINIIAVILITVGFSRHKKLAASPAKFKSIAIFYLIGLVLIISRIPWQNWL
ncbi:hypothetical protein EDD80_11180 [Anseongella ginsenosidimutans]|uniref:50S ribosomal protein L27 n=1 Tax=Anseongella ginsenosidimutans TaxID=496056 RepID=A0A4R3KMU5_9SPHI|nr:hypothetical protein [Anseongella ginsenosidimutans]QEC52017.1 hypothetical protein FRZ59_06530 [Anseongella ginsenosidimutans]TCS85678.1 hypothetical protein EDD80_11180 [Anseongella ginsenosidimutans]